MSNFEIWLGIPHETVKGLPEGTNQSTNVWGDGTPMGQHNDVKKVFSIIEENGEPVLCISGEIFGGATTKQEYEIYHFSTQFKWANKKWEPRLDQIFDRGILYHCYGEHGRFWSVWKTCIEYQVQETDLGDFISLGETTIENGESGPSAEIHRPIPEEEASKLDKPNGEWNLLEIYTVGNTSVHIVNGKVVQLVKNATIYDGSSLVKGQIQIQSEAAECYYKDMTLTPIYIIPEYIMKEA